MGAKIGLTVLVLISFTALFAALDQKRDPGKEPPLAVRALFTVLVIAIIVAIWNMD